jgi:hypothetical protein
MKSASRIVRFLSSRFTNRLITTIVRGLRVESAACREVTRRVSEGVVTVRPR